MYGVLECTEAVWGRDIGRVFQGHKAGRESDLVLVVPGGPAVWPSGERLLDWPADGPWSGTSGAEFNESWCMAV